MYDPFAPPQLPQQGQMQPMNAPQTVGMVPGVPGSTGLNPGQGGPVMTPGGGGTGAPVMAGGSPSFNNALGGFMQTPQFQGFLQRFPQFAQLMPPGGFGQPFNNQAMMDWRDARPDHQTYTGTDWSSAIKDWRSQRPARLAAQQDYNQPPPTASGATGGTGVATPQMFPPQPVPTAAPGAGWRFPRGGAGGGYGF